MINYFSYLYIKFLFFCCCWWLSSVWCPMLLWNSPWDIPATKSQIRAQQTDFILKPSKVLRFIFYMRTRRMQIEQGDVRFLHFLHSTHSPITAWDAFPSCTITGDTLPRLGYRKIGYMLIIKQTKSNKRNKELDGGGGEWGGWKE